MGQDSKIEWTNHTANLWHGCTKVHEGCDNCYAETLSKRWGNDVWGNDKPRKAINSVWKDLSKYQKLAKEANQIHRVFVGSMMDIFEKPMPLIDSKGNVIEGMDTGELRKVFFHSIGSGSYPNLMFLLLTKRPSPKGFITAGTVKDTERLKGWLGINYEGNIYYKDNHCPGQVLRNCVHPELGLYILEQAQGIIRANKSNQGELFKL